MSFNKKIDEWIKEAENRPDSALTLLRLITGRLRELTERNEELLAENIALQNGTRVEEYQQRIAHLEYQLDLLKRHIGAEGAELVEIPAQQTGPASTSLLVYNAQGRIFRAELATDRVPLGQIADKLTPDHEPPRLLAAPSNEEALLLYSSGRVSTVSVGDLPLVATGGDWHWEQATLPDEPRAGETLVCITPISRLPVSNYFMQISRRGCVKKTMTSMAQNILSNHFIGKGTLKKSDQPLDLLLCEKTARLAFVTYEGKLLVFDVEDLSYTVEERMKMSASDYVISSFVPHPDESLLFVTQTGKVLHRECSMLETSKSPLTKGQALISANRLEQGVRFMGAAAVQDGDQVAVLDATGTINVFEAGAMTGSGSIRTGGLVLSVGVIPAPAREVTSA